MERHSDLLMDRAIDTDAQTGNVIIIKFVWDY